MRTRNGPMNKWLYFIGGYTLLTALAACSLAFERGAPGASSAPDGTSVDGGRDADTSDVAADPASDPDGDGDPLDSTLDDALDTAPDVVDEAPDEPLTDVEPDDVGPCDGAGTNGCGGCGALPAAPGTPCGTCGGGTWTCLEQALFCDDSADVVNACGGCSTLEHPPERPCGCGWWVCDGADATRCELPPGDFCDDRDPNTDFDVCQVGRCAGVPNCDGGGCAEGCSSCQPGIPCAQGGCNGSVNCSCEDGCGCDFTCSGPCVTRCREGGTCRIDATPASADAHILNYGSTSSLRCDSRIGCYSDCFEGGSCDLECIEGAVCHSECHTGGTLCTERCVGDVDCYLYCHYANATCLLDCSQHTSGRCRIDACPSGVVDCGGGIYVCNMPCPVR